MREPVAFDTAAFVETLRPAAVAVGVPLSDEQVAQCVRYAHLLLETNAHTNLTRITEPREMAVKHFADSLTVLGVGADSNDAPSSRYPTPNTQHPTPSVCDVGTGAGFPGLVLKIARPDIRLTLLDSLQKRLTFLESVCRDLGFDDVRFVHSRADDAGRDPALRDGFDIVTARAVAALPTLLEWCLPLVRPGGDFVAMKSSNVDDELTDTGQVSGLLKARLTENRSLTLPTIPGAVEPPAERRILVYRKTAPTPARFPRNSSEIKRKPL